MVSCDGAPVEFTSNNVSAASPVDYQWLANGQPIAGAIGSTLEVTSSAEYALQVEDVFGCTFVSQPYEVEFFATTQPEIFAAGNSSFCHGDSLIIFTDAVPNVVYEWYVDSTLIQGASGFTNYFSQAGNYYVKVIYNGECEATSDEVTVTVFAPPTAPTVVQSNDTLFSSEASEYQWFTNGLPIFGEDEPFFVPTETGTYTVQITDSLGCTNSTEVFFFIYTIINSINDLNSIAELSLYPNPMTDRFTIKSDVLLTEVYVYDIRGALVHYQKPDFSSNSITVVKDDLQSGVYLVKVVSSEGAVGMMKVVKNN